MNRFSYLLIDTNDMVLIKLVQILISRLACLTVKGSVKIKRSIIRKLKIIVDVNNNLIMRNFHGYGLFFKILGGVIP